jgi:hypothetical protein
MSAAVPHLRLIDTETGEVSSHPECPHCAEARAEAEIWEQDVLKLKREIKRLQNDADEKALKDKSYPLAEELFMEWQRECISRTSTR